jgi:hypothetical protein
VSSKKTKRPRFVPQLLLTSTTLAGVAVLPAITVDCGGHVTANEPTCAQEGAHCLTVAAVFDAGRDGTGLTVAAAFDSGPDTSGFTVGAAYDSSFTVAAFMDSGNQPDTSGWGVAAIMDSGSESDAKGAHDAEKG